jgi:signal transduction histidine kinase
VWVATPNGIGEFRDGRWTVWTTKEGLPSSDVKLCFADSKNVLWVATADGLSFIADGRAHAVPDVPAPLREQVLGIAEDQLGFLWFSTPDQMLRVNRSRLLSGALAAGDLQSYGASDGLAILEPLRRERSLRSDDSGRIWASLTQGIAFGEPQLTDRDSAPVQVRIDSVVANGKMFAPGELSIVQSGTRSVIFHYASDDLFAPERVRFRYRLDGADADWSDSVESRQVLYNNLGPGSYHLHVLASRDGNFWNGPETVYDFSIAPTYWQTWWFRTLVLLLIALTTLLVVRLRHTRLERQLSARFHERLSERTRIAQELHDTLLQSFQGLMLRFQTAVNLLPGRPVDAKSVLEEALDRADNALAESRNAIQNIRSSASRDSNISESINGMMIELAREYEYKDQHPTFSVIVEGAPRPLKGLVSSEVFRIAQESARNAFQHARSNLIEASIRFEDARFQMRLRDDGVGIDSEVLKKGSRAGHWGLMGMKERAAQIGATLEIWSKPGAGTELELSVPGHIAYDRSQARIGSKTPGKEQP